MGKKAFGEENPTLGEDPVSWQTWSDGAAGIPTISGDEDWGKLSLALTGEEGRSAVYDLGSAATRKFTLTENRYGTGEEDADLQIRGDTSAFLQDDAVPAWENYVNPISRGWRYVQVRETTGEVPSDSPSISPSASISPSVSPSVSQSASISASISPSSSASPSEAEGELQFESGFEDDVYLTSDYILGTDNSATSGINNWNSLGNGTYLPWAKFQRFYYQGGQGEITADPLDENNSVLHFHNASAEGGLCRSQWSLKCVNQWTDDGTPNLFDKQFYRVKMYIPTETRDAYTLSQANAWYQIWESHVWDPLDFEDGENTRYAVYLDKFANEAWWHFRVVKQRPEGTVVWYNLTADPDWCDVNHAVPFGEWFTLEVYLKYHASEGEFYVAYQKEGEARVEVGHFVGQTKHDLKLHSNMLFKSYHDDEYLTKLVGGTHLYYDNLEIWSDYPPGY